MPEVDQPDPQLQAPPGGANGLALQRLRRMIVAGELHPGEQIRQQEMADLFGVSRGPLREAMNVLANQGLLLHKPNQGYFVTKRAPGEVEQIRRMRHALENVLIETVAWPDAACIARLREMNEEMRSYVARPDWSHLPNLNRNFHFVIYDHSPDHLILAEVRRLWSLVDPFTRVKYEFSAARQKTVDEHEAVILALEARSRAGLRAAMDQHRDSGREGLSTLLAGAADPHGLRQGIGQPRAAP